MSEAPQQSRKRRRQPKQEQQQYYHQQQQQPPPPPPPQMMNSEFLPNSTQMQQDLMTYQSWLKDQLQYTAFLQQNGPVAQYMKMQQRRQPHRQQQPHYSQNNGLQNRPQPYRGPPGRGGNKPPQRAGKLPQQGGTRRNVATWTCYEPDGPPRTYFSPRPWKAQLQVLATCPDDQCSKVFRGRTLSAFLLHAPNALMPPDPESRYCDDCGGLIINELRHKQSRLHREAVEMDVSLICSRIRRDPAFASAVIAAARECIENTGVEESGHDDDDGSTDEGNAAEGGEDDDGPPPAKQPRPSGSKAADEFEFLEGDVFRRAPLQKKAN